ILTDMSEPLGRAVGNSVEVREAIDFLVGRRRAPRLDAVTSTLAEELLVLGGLATTPAHAATAVQRALASGAAAEPVARMVTALGGPADLVENADRHLPCAPVTLSVAPNAPGIVTSIDARAIGLIVMHLGGGRRQADDVLDPGVGLTEVRCVGDTVGPEA